MKSGFIRLTLLPVALFACAAAIQAAEVTVIAPDSPMLRFALGTFFAGIACARAEAVGCGTAAANRLAPSLPQPEGHVNRFVRGREHGYVKVDSRDWLLVPPIALLFVLVLVIVLVHVGMHILALAPAAAYWLSTPPERQPARDPSTSTEPPWRGRFFLRVRLAIAARSCPP